jgi:hypothetical protein
MNEETRAVPHHDDDFDSRPRRRRFEDDDDFDRPRRKKGGGVNVGVIIAIIVGVVALLGCGGVAVVVFLITRVAEAGLRPAVERVREASARVETHNNLKEVALGVMNYADRNNRFPPAAITEPNRPNGRRLLSWRVAILPYMQQDELYRRFKLDEPWDSPANRPLIQEMPRAFQSPGDPQPGRTHFRVFVGGRNFDRPRALFEWDLQRSVGPAGVPDGLTNTLMVVEAADAVEWTKPDDFDYDPDRPLPRLGLPGQTRFNAAFADGSTRVLSVNMPETNLRNLITRNDGFVVNFD